MCFKFVYGCNLISITVFCVLCFAKVCARRHSPVKALLSVHTRLIEKVPNKEYTTALLRELAEWKLCGRLSEKPAPCVLSAEHHLPAASIVSPAWGRMTDIQVPPTTAELLGSLQETAHTEQTTAGGAAGEDGGLGATRGGRPSVTVGGGRAAGPVVRRGECMRRGSGGQPPGRRGWLCRVSPRGDRGAKPSQCARRSGPAGPRGPVGAAPLQ